MSKFPPTSVQSISVIGSESSNLCSKESSTRSHWILDDANIEPSKLIISPPINQVPLTGELIVVADSESLPGGGSIITPPPSSVRGVHLRKSAVSTAQDASANPKPHLSFHVLPVVSGDWEEGSVLTSLEFLKISLTSCGVRLLSACSIIATIPEITGVDIEVPSFES